jgi:hypothetical protein
MLLRRITQVTGRIWVLENSAVGSQHDDNWGRYEGDFDGTGALSVSSA